MCVSQKKTSTPVLECQKSCFSLGWKTYIIQLSSSIVHSCSWHHRRRLMPWRSREDVGRDAVAHFLAFREWLWNMGQKNTGFKYWMLFYVVHFGVVWATCPRSQQGRQSSDRGKSMEFSSKFLRAPQSPFRFEIIFRRTWNGWYCRPVWRLGRLEDRLGR